MTMQPKFWETPLKDCQRSNLKEKGGNQVQQIHINFSESADFERYFADWESLVFYAGTAMSGNGQYKLQKLIIQEHKMYADQPFKFVGRVLGTKTSPGSSVWTSTRRHLSSQFELPLIPPSSFSSRKPETG
ncbi:hypothetical protein FE257_001628 [Aspergillus nanangensis]|uniref:Uncharacterized protein n=1 Tax=Aspergillus nanangensis TaxID=2582783 RepID=A0AAD4CTP6_ASPNN|nr:hypothetical protein FE257_001628 [Aspergillus nanangensis]